MVLVMLGGGVLIVERIKVLLGGGVLLLGERLLVCMSVGLVLLVLGAGLMSVVLVRQGAGASLMSVLRTSSMTARRAVVVARRGCMIAIAVVVRRGAGGGVGRVVAPMVESIGLILRCLGILCRLQPVNYLLGRGVRGGDQTMQVLFFIAKNSHLINEIPHYLRVGCCQGQGRIVRESSNVGKSSKLSTRTIMPAVPSLALPTITVEVELLSGSNITRNLEPVRLQRWFLGLFIDGLSKCHIAIFNGVITRMNQIILRNTHCIILVVIIDVIIVGGLNGGSHGFQYGLGHYWAGKD